MPYLLCNTTGRNITPLIFQTVYETFNSTFYKSLPLCAQIIFPFVYILRLFILPLISQLFCLCIAAINMGILISLCSAWLSSEIARCYIASVFRVLRNLHIILHNSCINLLSFLSPGSKMLTSSLAFFFYIFFSFFKL